MKYISRVKILIGLIKFTRKHLRSKFTVKHNKLYIPFLNFLIARGVVYFYSISASGSLSVFVKTEHRNIFIEQKAFNYSKSRYGYIKKKLYKLTSSVVGFSTNKGILDSKMLGKEKIGGLHLITV